MLLVLLRDQLYLFLPNCNLAVVGIEMNFGSFEMPFEVLPTCQLNASQKHKSSPIQAMQLNSQFCIQTEMLA